MENIALGIFAKLVRKLKKPLTARLPIAISILQNLSALTLMMLSSAVKTSLIAPQTFARTQIIRTSIHVSCINAKPTLLTVQ